jgi:LuxR family maltose regulon positive regulatory protein
MVAAGLSFAAIVAGDLAHSEQIARRTLEELGDDSGTLWLRVHFYTMLGIVARLRGRLHEAEGLCGRAVALLDDSPVPAPTPTALPALNEAAVVRFQRDDLDGAAELQRRCAALVASSADRTLWLPVRWVEARLVAARGDLAGALALLERAAASARDSAGSQRPAMAPNASMRRAVIEAERVRLSLRMGRLAAAEAAAADLAALGLPAEQPAPYFEIALAAPRLLMGRGDYGAAIAGLGRLIAAAERAGFSGLTTLALALRAVAQRAAGDMAAAEANLVKALDAGEIAANVRLWLDEGEPLRATLAAVRARLLARGAADAAAERALRVCDLLLARFAGEGARPASPPAQAPRAAPQPLAEPLTQRELDVLRLLAAGRSNREIAAELVVALGTVKRHVANLCAKLGAPSRLAAVALARERGLI